MGIKTLKNIGLIEAGIYKVNSVFSFHQTQHARNFVTGIIVDPKTSILRISRLFGEKNHSNLDKFFTKDWWDEEKVNKKRIIEFINKDDAYVLVSDDTNNKKSGKKIKGTGIYRSHTGGFEKAHNKVVTGLVNQKREYLPLFSTVYLKEEDAKKEGVIFRTKHEIAREHNKKAKQLGLKFYTHLYDSWYFNHDMVEFSEGKEWIVSQLSGKFNVTINGKTMKASGFKKTIDKRKMNVLHINGKRVRYLEFIAELSTGVKVKLMPFIDKGRDVKILVSTNLNWSAKRIFQEYAKRQSIEVYIRDCKQELNFGKSKFKELKPHLKWDVLVMLIQISIRNFISLLKLTFQK